MMFSSSNPAISIESKDLFAACFLLDCFPELLREETLLR